MNDAVQFHSQIASGWESNYASDVFSVRMKVLDGLLAGRDLSGQKWLDAGCSTGTLARFLASHKGCKVLGVDASEEMISQCAPAPKHRVSPNSRYLRNRVAGCSLRRRALLEHA